MSSQRVTNPSDHRDQMNIARELQLARTAISATRQRSRGRGGRGGRARGDSCGLTPPFETHAAASNGDRATRGRGTSTSLGTFGGLGGPSALRSGARGAGLSTSIWAPSAVPDYGTSQMLGRAVPSSSPESAGLNDAMEVGHPATTSTTTTTSSVAQHPAYPNSFAPESAAEESVPENQLAEGNILDLPIPSVPRLEEATEPTRMQTMFPRNPGLGASRWAPRTTLDGRPIED